MSPVTTIRDPNPSLVRNIFSCSGLVFCASSRMMNESLSDLAAHEGQRRNLDDVAVQVGRDPVGVEHVVEGVEARAQVKGFGPPWDRPQGLLTGVPNHHLTPHRPERGRGTPIPADQGNMRMANPAAGVGPAAKACMIACQPF
jgi:hypothetical protein